MVDGADSVGKSNATEIILHDKFNQQHKQSPNFQQKGFSNFARNCCRFILHTWRPHVWPCFLHNEADAHLASGGSPSLVIICQCELSTHPCHWRFVAAMCLVSSRWAPAPCRFACHDHMAGPGPSVKLGQNHRLDILKTPFTCGSCKPQLPKLDLLFVHQHGGHLYPAATTSKRHLHPPETMNAGRWQTTLELVGEII